MMLRLKAVDMREHNLILAAKQWKKSEEVVSLGYPDFKGKWVKVSDSEKKWSGWIRLYELIALASPKLAGMALTEKTERLILNWFSLTERPFSVDLPEINFEKLVISEVIQDSTLNNKLMLQVRTREVSVWLDELNFQPETDHVDISCFQDIGWPVQFILGSTRIRFHLFKRIKCGDILIIKNISTQVRCFNRYLFHYEWSDEFIMTEQIETETENEVEIEVETDAESIYDMNQLPVQLEFIIYRRVLKLNDIKELSKNKIYPLPQDIEHEIEIRVNGALIGCGELLQFDGKLGVEITTWLQESQHDK
ncbi:TPA: YscQ/HrcQ family type III secretion apparatus protein [Yersinia enterocolitica]|nr:YscQ/HrcQ family type III secretion apparatus protein [Yersinia enterocolitica]HDL6985272.1 YscQ/HrcQ family type III secretion apparatus protein [Yersinia enterocolitica]HDL7067814.1 YscQ/HrcQ family type III secretion apparatus protein [Yersinia enterocolitica]HDL7072203.1 YscQ/HrcQ family type III secretion apparatus protein [Yersinia enterocolitica]